MKSCPGCLFLIDDDQERCETCVKQKATELPPIQIGSAGGATAVLDRSVKVAAPEEMLDLRYRPARRTVTVKGVIIGVLICALVGALASAGGYGPLAPKFAAWNLTINRPEAFPQDWQHLDDLSTVFEVDLPGGSKSLFEQLDPDDPTQGGIVGKTVTTVHGAKMQVAWSDFGVSPESLATFNSPDGIQQLLGRYAAARVPGKMTISRPVVLPIGQAVDGVFVNDDVTTRVRVVMTPKEAFILSTSGADSDALALDAAHQRLLESFRPNL
ncbi:MAG: hypothetical protein WBA45_16205 [Microthrixaceae bacterium]